uniref:Uncharacterized protein n=1 Tax=Picea sitchensis TaxID=3332 RepID=A9P1M5_PICSI|nr:unknown [Picea sitchensis]ACN40441.1 unknown [Picea sitchensis]
MRKPALMAQVVYALLFLFQVLFATIGCHALALANDGKLDLQMNMGLADQWSWQGRKITEESQMRGRYEYNRYADRGRRPLLSRPPPLGNPPHSYNQPPQHPVPLPPPPPLPYGR